MVLLRTCISIAGMIFIISFLLIVVRLQELGLYTFNDLRRNPVWPIIIFEYTKYFKNNYGKVPMLYFISTISGTLFILLLFINFLF